MYIFSFFVYNEMRFIFNNSRYTQMHNIYLKPAFTRMLLLSVCLFLFYSMVLLPDGEKIATGQQAGKSVAEDVSVCCNSPSLELSGGEGWETGKRYSGYDYSFLSSCRCN